MRISVCCVLQFALGRAHSVTTIESCYHCGLPIPAGIDLTVEIARKTRRMCCAGCQGRSFFNRQFRAGGLLRSSRCLTRKSSRGAAACVGKCAARSSGNTEEFVHGLDAANNPHIREAALILEGITCAACVWLNEQHLVRLPGVTGVDINYTTRRARVRWDERQIRLSTILDSIAAIGYRAHPYDVSRAEELARSERRQSCRAFRRRLRHDAGDDVRNPVCISPTAI